VPPGLLYAQQQYRQTRTDLTFSTSRVRTKFDGGGGDSGSGFFYCPTDCNTPYLIGLWTLWKPVLNRHSGPRVHRFKSFVEDNLP
jgi:hypothetical protein